MKVDASGLTFLRGQGEPVHLSTRAAGRAGRLATAEGDPASRTLAAPEPDRIVLSNPQILGAPEGVQTLDPDRDLAPVTPAEAPAEPVPADAPRPGRGLERALEVLERNAARVEARGRTVPRGLARAIDGLRARLGIDDAPAAPADPTPVEEPAEEPIESPAGPGADDPADAVEPGILLATTV
ncbi:MAG: hypothetical protein ACE5IK_04550 [Acidobacteriota bacterium]